VRTQIPSAPTQASIADLQTVTCFLTAREYKKRIGSELRGSRKRERGYELTSFRVVRNTRFSQVEEDLTFRYFRVVDRDFGRFLSEEPAYGSRRSFTCISSILLHVRPFSLNEEAGDRGNEANLFESESEDCEFLVGDSVEH